MQSLFKVFNLVIDDVTGEIDELKTDLYNCGPVVD
jgi:hypothetical protein